MIDEEIEVDEKYRELLEAGRARYSPDLAVWPCDLDEGLISFRAGLPFEVDGILYDSGDGGNVRRLMVQDVELGHDCTGREHGCTFGWGVDRVNPDVDVQGNLGDAYQWSPPMVYYKSTEFDTPIYGG